MQLLWKVNAQFPVGMHAAKLPADVGEFQAALDAAFASGVAYGRHAEAHYGTWLGREAHRHDEQKAGAFRNAARMLAVLESEVRRLHSELTAAQSQEAAPAARGEPSDEHVSVVGMPEFDALIDHIYEHGTTSEGVVIRADALARALLSRYGRRAGDAQPAAWVAADTLHSPHPGCVSSLAYMSQIDKDRGREYVPLYAAPAVQGEPVAYISQEDFEFIRSDDMSEQYGTRQAPVFSRKDYRVSVPLYASPQPPAQDVSALVEALEAENERLREDAERYRLLRKGAVEDVAVVRGLGAMDYGMSAVVPTYDEELYGDYLDAAIDAALAKENKA